MHVQLAMSRAYIYHIQVIIHLPAKDYSLGSNSLSNAGLRRHLQQRKTHFTLPIHCPKTNVFRRVFIFYFQYAIRFQGKLTNVI